MSLGQCFPNLLNDKNHQKIKINKKFKKKKNHQDADLQFTVPNSLPEVLSQQVRGRGSFFFFFFFKQTLQVTVNFRQARETLLRSSKPRNGLCVRIT